MLRFEETKEFSKEFSRLSKKYRSLPEDRDVFEGVLRSEPFGIGKHFAVLYRADEFVIIKARMACKSLRSSDIRIIYAYHEGRAIFLYVEVYFKGEKQNEDLQRIREYIAKQKHE